MLVGIKLYCDPMEVNKYIHTIHFIGEYVIKKLGDHCSIAQTVIVYEKGLWPRDPCICLFDVNKWRIIRKFQLGMIAGVNKHEL